MTHIPTSTGPAYTERCTPEERRLLDALDAAEKPPEPDMAHMIALVEAQQAVIDAAVAETRAEKAAIDAVGRAFTTVTRSHRIAAANEATSAAQAAQIRRREAVAALHELERSTPT